MPTEPGDEPQKMIFIVGAIVGIGLLFVLFFNLLPHAQEAIKYTTEILSGRDIEITSQEMFEETMLCLHQMAKGCDQVSKGVWKTLEGTILEDCPCAKDFIAGYDVYATINSEKGIEINQGLGEFQKIWFWSKSCVGYVLGLHVNGLLLYNFPNVKETGLDANLEEKLTIPDKTKLTMVVNTRNLLVSEDIQGCIEYKGKTG